MQVYGIGQMISFFDILLTKSEKCVIISITSLWNSVMEEGAVMPNDEAVTREKILDAARAEFSDKGFRDASLRAIVKAAGVSTGSFYWHYENKEQLFEAVVGVHYEHIMELYERTLEAFRKLSKEEQSRHMGDLGGKCMLEMYNYMHRHKTEFRILLGGADGTKYDNMLHELTEREIAATHEFQEHMRELGTPKRDMSPELEHIVTSGMFAGLFELITHDIPVRKARKCVRELHDFYTAGFAYSMGMPLPDTMR